MYLRKKRGGSGRLTRRERSRHSYHIAGGVFVLGLVGLAVGSMVSLALGTALALVFSTTYMAAAVSRDLAILRRDVSQQGAILAIDPLRAEPYPLNPAALGPENMLLVLQQLSLRAPKISIEFGSGISTLMIARSLKAAGLGGHLYSFEHEKVWFNVTRQALERDGLSPFVTLVHAPLVALPGTSTDWYDSSLIPDGCQDVGLVLVDGPEGGTTAPLARMGALPSIKERLSPGAVVFLDDGCRRGEEEIARRWESENPSYKKWFYGSHSGMWVFEVPSLGDRNSEAE